jgi:flagella basal body P-ring formation protein FlgA
MTRIVAIIVALAIPLSAAGVEVKLREQVALTASVVRLGDVAEVSAEDAARTDELAAIMLFPAPAPGTSHYLGAAQLRDILAANGVDLADLKFSGAAASSLSSPAVNAAPAGAEGATASPEPALDAASKPDREAVVAHVTAAIVRYLQEKTGHDLWDVKVDADADVLDMYWQYGPALTVAGGREPWTGRMHFEIRGATSPKAVRAYARVQRLEMTVVAGRGIAVGDLIRATDVVQRPAPAPLPANAARSLEHVVGKEAVRVVREGAILLTANLKAPLLVRQGERVSIKARAAGIVVRTYATAQQNGCMGDLVQVQAIDGKERYAARVSGLRELELFAAGTTASDVAAATR